MRDAFRYLNRTVAALLALVMFSLPVIAAETRLDTLFTQLEGAPPEEARRIASEIEMEWAKSGSPAMDLLLRRGKDALEAGDMKMAVEHLSAAIDHAPGFAEAWHLRSVAFFRQERHGLALSDLAQVIILEPRHFNALFGMGRVLEETGRLALAHDAFARAQAIHPHHEAVSEALERVSREMGGTDL
ncbi:tetratricopeptide repeat protein [Roseovarius ramblicola]|uniref:Tetratricopeptide repeat protein n=1 Tax=Roseovarius ramblicola TaxID=2022336 RepID=A0ABV5HX21_9RHOB